MQKKELELSFEKRLSVNLKQMPQSGKVSGFFSVNRERDAHY